MEAGWGWPERATMSLGSASDMIHVLARERSWTLVFVARPSVGC